MIGYYECGKSARIHWKDDAPKTSHCLVRILVQWHNWAIFLRKWARRVRYSQWRSFWSHVERGFVHKNWMLRRILATFGFNRTALRATQPKLHSMFCALFLKIALSAAELMSLGQLGAAIWRRWTIICGSETIDTFKDNIREAISEIQVHTTVDVLQNWPDRVGYCMACRGSYLNEIIFHH